MRFRAHPDQAGFVRRFFAFAIDIVLVTLVALILYVAYTEIRSVSGDEQGLIGRIVEARRSGRSVAVSIGPDSQWEKTARKTYLAYLKDKISNDDFLRASEMSAEMIQHEFRVEMERPEAPLILHSGGHGFEIVRELVVGYLYFMFFFRTGGRTPGKRIWGLKVIDLAGRPNLSLYQAFERTHGYAASLLIGGLGFFQVFWDKGGQTMHDKLSGTTVVRLSKRPPVKPAPDPAEPQKDDPAEAETE